ncbi:MAG: acyl-CoA dehydrogenase family protein [Nocardioidaceae bacterium]
MRGEFYDEDHKAFRDTVREFVRREVVPHQDAWENIGHIDPSLWGAAGNQGLLGLDFPEQYGGGGVDDLVGPYLVDLGTDDRRTRWLAGLAQRRHGGRARRRRQDG